MVSQPTYKLILSPSKRTVVTMRLVSWSRRSEERRKSVGNEQTLFDTPVLRRNGRKNGGHRWKGWAIYMGSLESRYSLVPEL